MQERFGDALTFVEFLAGAREHREMWHQLFRRARVPQDLLDRAGSLPGSWNLLALCEDWCGDGLNTLPYLARLSEEVPGLSLRVLSRDANPDLMDSHLSGGNRSIPVVMILSDTFREVGWWGPRPAPLQEIFLKEIQPLPAPDRYPRLRAWYARDRGRTAVEEVLDLLASAS